jgi:hypothetical protein
MHRIGLFLLLAVLSSAQNNPFNRPPADVDAALRARITEFYQYHVDGEFRKADALVAEDTKDYYFTSAKPHYLSFEISRIDYSDNFTKAKAVIMCEMYIMMPGFADKPTKMPTPSAWKIQDGKWFWYVDQKALRDTPFGPMTPGPRSQRLPANAPSLASLAISPDFLMSQIKVNKEEIDIWPGDSAELIVANTAPGLMEVKVFAAPDGVDAKLDKSSLQANETTALKIKTSKDSTPGTVTLHVEPTGQVISVLVKLKGMHPPSRF